MLIQSGLRMFTKCAKEINKSLHMNFRFVVKKRVFNAVFATLCSW